jgi:hypothetical protein
LLSSWVTLGFAQSPSPGTPDAAQPAAARLNLVSTNGTGLNKSRNALSNRMLFNGVVSELNLSNRWFEVRGTNGTQRFSFATNSRVLLTGSPIPVSELRPGDRVGVIARVGTNDLPEILGVRVGARPPGGGNVKRTNPAPTD